MKMYHLRIEEQMNANGAYKRAAYDLPRVGVLNEDRLEDQLDIWESK